MKQFIYFLQTVIMFIRHMSIAQQTFCCGYYIGSEQMLRQTVENTQWFIRNVTSQSLIIEKIHFMLNSHFSLRIIN